MSPQQPHYLSPEQQDKALHMKNRYVTWNNIKWSLGGFLVLLACAAVIWQTLFMANGRDKICLRPTVWLDVPPNQYLDRDEAASLIGHIMFSYSGINLLPDKNMCGQAPRLSLRLEVKRSTGGVQLDATLTDLDNSDMEIRPDVAIWYKSYILGDGNLTVPIEDSLVDMIYHIGDRDNEVLQKFAQMTWADKNAQQNYQCAIFPLNEQTAHQTDKLTENFQCLAQQVEDYSPFADVYARYATWLYHNRNDTIDFDKGHYSDKMSYAIKQAKKINPNNAELLSLELMQARFGNQIDYGKMVRIMKVIEDYHLYQPRLLMNHAKLNALYFGKYERGYVYSARASRILNSNYFNYVVLVKYIMSHEWDEARDYMSSFTLARHPNTALFALLVGGETNDEKLIAFALEVLRENDLKDLAKTVAYSERQSYHYQLRNRLTDAVRKYYRKAPGYKGQF